MVLICYDPGVDCLDDLRWLSVSVNKNVSYTGLLQKK